MQQVKRKAGKTKTVGTNPGQPKKHSEKSLEQIQPTRTAHQNQG